ncbi:MAG: hypothetical protein PVG92_04480 [Holophagae bacterium]|jgi:hypothetical protein
MTHREYFNKRKRKFMAWFGVVVLIGITCSFLSIRNDLLFLVTLASVPAMMLVLWTAVVFGMRCPSCRGQWGYLAMYSGGLLSIRRGLTYCPYCGVRLDDPAPAG